MTTTLIVLAHPEPTSFNADWARATAGAVEAAGEKVIWSDLYALGFDAAERGAFYSDETPFDPLKAQAKGDWPPDVSEEVKKIRAADNLIFHFPLWWFGPPAILKGWCDRVLVHGALHDVDHRFEAGPCRGKRVLFCVTTGASEIEVGPGGKEGRLDLLLWPLAYALYYCGFSIIKPSAVHSVHGYWEGAREAALEAQLKEVLAAAPNIVAGLSERSCWRFNRDEDYDATGRLKPGVVPVWPFMAT